MTFVIIKQQKLIDFCGYPYNFGQTLTRRLNYETTKLEYLIDYNDRVIGYFLQLKASGY